MAAFLGMHKDDLIRVFVLLVVFHDLGKFASAFQGLNTYSDKRLWPGNAKYPYDAAHAHHDRLGSCFWDALKDHFLGLFADVETLSSREQRKALDSLWVLVECSLGHHGQPITPDMGADALVGRYTHPHDFEAASLFLHDVCRIGDLSPAELSAQFWADKELKDRLKQLSWPLAGIVVLADWLGSNREYFPYVTEPMPLETYWAQTLAQAEQALQKTEMADVPIVSKFESVEQHFHFPPSPLQRWAENVQVDGTPQLFILEDVTGAGKTEAALALTHRLLQAGAADGFYFGLPTMATSNAMFNRVADYYVQMLRRPDGSTPSIVLAHGARDMHPVFRQAVQAAAQEDGAYAAGDDTATLQCNQWLSDSRKKALLAPVGVGTIDQALLAVLPRRHQSLRLLGLSRKVLVFDEVHAADAYMFELLEGLLTLHLHQGGSAVLLTATLPRAQRQRLVNIWLKGIQAPAHALQNDSFPLATTVNLHRKSLVHEQTVASRPESERHVDARFLEGVASCVARLVEVAEQGQCAVWVRNTVAEAIEAYQAVREQLSDPERCLRVPRASGAEPSVPCATPSIAECSPRKRG